MPDDTDFEARCPKCRHGGFRVSKPRVKKYRHIWTCACELCKCKAGDLRIALLNLGIAPWCLGTYDGPVEKGIDPEVARRQDLAISDILAIPHLKPADMRIVLAEARGWKIPAEYREFVKFAKAIGIGHQQAYEAARRWVSRPSDLSPPQTGGQVVDTSRSTDAIGTVKPPRSGPRKATETVELAYGNRREDRGEGPTETVKRTLDDNKNRRPAA